MTTPPPAEPTSTLEIRKYPNRRLYDATRSCHVTLAELYDLVASGHTVQVKDSKSGEDITNQVLLQAIAERDPLKITAVPSPVIHAMIRVNDQLIASWFDLFFRQAMDAFRAAGGPAASGWWPGMQAPGGWPGAAGAGSPWAWPASPANPMSPMAWMESFLSAAARTPPTAADAEPEPSADEPETMEAPEPDPEAEDLRTLREQVAKLAAEVKRLSEKGSGK